MRGLGHPVAGIFFPLPEPECCYGHPASNLGDFVFLLRNSPVCSDGHSGAIFGTLTFGIMTFGTWPDAHFLHPEFPGVGTFTLTPHV